MMNKYIHLQIDGQTEIGVLDLGAVNLTITESKYKQIIEPKLIKALNEHYDCEVKIIDSHFRSIHPIEVNYIVRIGSDNGDYNENVLLTETWVY